MWLFFIVLQLTGAGPSGQPREQTVDYRYFNTEAECLAAKTTISEYITAKYPSSMSSLTCVKISRMGLAS